jgi:glycopeptide antibiotics resistance protein
MALLNLWSLGHFIQWSFVGRFLLKNWYLFLVLSIGWEVLELYLPYEFAKETWENKISDIFVNILGFWLGKRIRIELEARL